MLINYESIIILNESVCSDFIDGDIKFKVFQSMTPLIPKPNCFIQNSSAIQYINPMLNEKEGKLKFSVSYKPNELSSLQYAAIVFNKNICCTAEIRIKNEVLTNEETTFRIIKLVPLPESEKLELIFVPEDNNDDIISEQIQILSEQNIRNNNDISELEKILYDEKEKACKLSNQKTELMQNIASTKVEIENILSAQNELNDLEDKRETVRHNFEEASTNIQNAEELNRQLSYYNDILIFYKNDEGYQTISEKINELKNDISIIEQHISEFVQKRNDQIDQIADQLNI